MQRVQNMGSLLQAYALKKTLENLGADVEFIDIKRIESDNQALENYVLDYSFESEKKNLSSKLNVYLPFRIKNHYSAKHQNELFESFRTSFLKKEKTSSNYDLCVIGSDEVFNCLAGGKWGFTTQLFGNVPEAKRVITYAASCGATKFEDLPPLVSEKIKKAFKNIDGFSVRDNNTYNFVTALTDRKIQYNLDPVLIYNFDKEIKTSILPKLPKKYCIIYSYANRINSIEDIKAILSFCKKNKMTPIAVGTPQFWINHYIPCSPFECLKLFSEAEFVFTDTFHGTIFSAKYAKHFAVMLRDSNRNKLEDLITRISMDKHLVESTSQLGDVYLLDKDNTSFEKIVTSERLNTNNYLKGFVS